MKVRKNFEAVFLAAVAVAALASVATASVPKAAEAPKVVAVADTTMQVVEVKHKRLSAEEKAQLN